MEEVGWAERATPISMLRPYDNGVLDSGTALLKFTKIGVGIVHTKIYGLPKADRDVCGRI